jgi:hypothetical protein
LKKKIVRQFLAARGLAHRKHSFGFTEACAPPVEYSPNLSDSGLGELFPRTKDEKSFPGMFVCSLFLVRFVVAAAMHAVSFITTTTTTRLCLGLLLAAANTVLLAQISALLLYGYTPVVQYI